MSLSIATEELVSHNRKTHHRRASRPSGICPTSDDRMLLYRHGYKDVAGGGWL